MWGINIFILNILLVTSAINHLKVTHNSKIIVKCVKTKNILKEIKGPFVKSAMSKKD